MRSINEPLPHLRWKRMWLRQSPGAAPGHPGRLDHLRRCGAALRQGTVAATSSCSAKSTAARDAGCLSRRSRERTKTLGFLLLFFLLALLGTSCLHESVKPLPPPWRVETIPAHGLNPPPQTILFSPGEQPIYRAVEIQIAFNNLQKDGLERVRLRLTLPPGLQGLKLPPGSVMDGADVVLPEIGRIAPGKSALTRVFLSARSPGDHLLKLTGTFQYSDGISRVNADPAEIAVGITAPRLGVAVIPPDCLAPGCVSRWRFAVRNTGNAEAGGVFLSWHIPDGLRFLASPNGHYAGGTLSCNLGSLQPGEAKTAEVSVTAVNPRQVQGEVIVSARGLAPLSAPAVATYAHQPFLKLRIISLPDGVKEISVANAGSEEAQSVVVSCTIDNDQLPSQIKGATPGKIDERNVIFDRLPRLPPGAGARWELHYDETAQPEFSVSCRADHLDQPLKTRFPLEIQAEPAIYNRLDE